MSIVHAQSTISAQKLPGSGDVVTLTAAAASDIEFMDISEVGFRIDNDGNVYRKQGYLASYIQVNSTNDWVRPTTSAPGLYEVRYTSLTGHAMQSQTATEDTWHDLSTSDFTLTLRTIGLEDERSNSFIIEIRLDGGAVLDSAIFTMDVARFDF